jgi:hypothetical protein
MKKVLEVVKLILHHEKQILVLEKFKVKIPKLVLEVRVKMKLELEKK